MSFFFFYIYVLPALARLAPDDKNRPNRKIKYYIGEKKYDHASAYLDQQRLLWKSSMKKENNYALD